MLFLFFDSQNPSPSLEREELTQTTGSASRNRIGTLEEFDPDTFDALTSLQDALNNVQKHDEVKPLASIQSAEIVLDDSGGKWLPCWRIEVKKHDLSHCVVLVKPTGASEVDCERRSISCKRLPWEVGAAIRYKVGTLRIRIPYDKVSLTKKRRARLTTWACLCRAQDFFRELGYKDLDLQTIKIGYEYSVETCGVTSRSHDIPIIVLGYNNFCAEAPDILLHELGHAIWLLFYTRWPYCLEKQSRRSPSLIRKWTKGVEEGFADYLAATLLSKSSHHPISIGQYLPAAVLKKAPRALSLPRSINKEYKRPTQSALNKHALEEQQYIIGDQWANLLWALRCYLETQNVSSIDINQLVLNAHLRPPPNLTESDVWDCYVQSICETSKLMDVNLNGWPGCL
jgi:hypothetical protein